MVKLNGIHIVASLLTILDVHASEESRCSSDSDQCYGNKNNKIDRTETHTPEWHDYTIADFWENYECEVIFESLRPVHNHSTWMLLRGVYTGTVGLDRSSIAPLTHTNGIHVPHFADQSPQKGRGLFAAESVNKGELVWNSRQTACFSDGGSYRRFLSSIPSDLTCDVLQWAYVVNSVTGFGGGEFKEDSKEEGEKNLTICVDLDEGILINTGTYDIEDVKGNGAYYIGKVNNIGCDPEAAKLVKGGCKNNLFALKNIQAGEEFLVGYGDFAEEDGWEEFGLY